MSPRVSVIMAARNAADTIAASLRSLQRQTLQDWECIVVDDGSEDDTAARVEAMIHGEERVRLLSIPPSGVVEARNRAAAAARGPAIAVLDADDVAHRQRLALQWQQFEAQGGGVVTSFARYFRREAVGPGLDRYQQWLRRQRDGVALRRARYIEMPYAHSTLMLERALGDQVGWYEDHGWPEDFDLSLRLAASTAPHGVVTRALVGWRVRAQSASRTDARYTLQAFMRCRAAALARDYLTAGSAWMLWGHGDTGKALRLELAQLGRVPSAILDVDPRKIGQRIEGVPVIDALAWLAQHDPEPRLIISVAGQAARAKIRAALAPTGRVEGEGYFFAA